MWVSTIGPAYIGSPRAAALLDNNPARPVKSEKRGRQPDSDGRTRCASILTTLRRRPDGKLHSPPSRNTTISSARVTCQRGPHAQRAAFRTAPPFQLRVGAGQLSLA